VAVLRVLTGLIVAGGCAAIPWLAWRSTRVSLSTIGALALAVMLFGAIVGVGLYPTSDVVVLAFAIPGGILLGRALPPRFRPFFLLLIALSVLDLVQVALTSGPVPGGPTPSSGLNPHLIWVDFRVGLPGGHFTIGFVDLLLITAMSEHFRRRDQPVAMGLLPGVVGVALAELVSRIGGSSQGPVVATLEQALIPYLTAGWLVASWLSRRRAIPAERRSPAFATRPAPTDDHGDNQDGK
jgi:hypothetical protein